MRVRSLSPLVAAAVVAGGIAVMAAQPSQAAPVKLYFRSAGGGYLNDVQADPFGPDDDSAPDGSTLDPKAPTRTTDSTAMSGSPTGIAGEPLAPTFTLPFTGDITSVCLDLWVKSNAYLPVFQYGILTSLNTPDDRLSLTDAIVSPGPVGGTLIRVTTLVKPDGAAKFTIPKDSEFMFQGFINSDVDLTLVYDSVTHPSSITINTTECKPAPVPTAAPSASATPKPSGSATATPSASATATPKPTTTASATPTASATATPSGTPSPTATPSPSPTTPPPPARETGLDYTGSSAGRYSDSALVSAKATLPDGSPVPTGSVEFAVGSDKVTLPVNSEGVASGRLPLRTTRPGEYLMTVRYVANSAYLGSAEQVPFVVQRMGTRCAIARTTSGSNYVVTGTLRDALGRVLAGQMVTFSYNGKAFRSLRTDRNGRAQASIAARRGTYTVSLPTTSHYAGCSASFRV